MTQPSHIGDNLPEDLNSPELIEQARVHLDEAARLGRELVKQATSASYSILAHDEQNKVTQQEQERIKSAYNIVLGDFMNCLPHIGSLDDKLHTFTGDARLYDRELLPFKTESLEEAVMLRSVLWLYEGSYYYLIGREQIRVDDESFDAIDGVLLYPAEPEGKLQYIKASARKIDLFEELAIEELRKPVDSRDALNKFLLPDGGFRVPKPIKWCGSGRSSSYNTVNRLMMSKRKDPEKEKSKLTRRGLPYSRSEFDFLHGRISEYEYRSLNVPYYTLKLASILNKGEAYDATIAHLGTSQ